MSELGLYEKSLHPDTQKQRKGYPGSVKFSIDPIVGEICDTMSYNKGRGAFSGYDSNIG